MNLKGAKFNKPDKVKHLSK